MNRAPDPPAGSRLLSWLTIIAATAFGIGCAVMLAQWLLPTGHWEVWTWTLRTKALPPLPWTGPVAIGLLLIALLGLDTLRDGKVPSGAKCAMIVIGLTVGSGCLIGAMAVDDTEYPYRASATILGNMSMGYYLEARQIDSVRGWIADVDRRTNPAIAPERVATHPPGPTLYYWAVRQWLVRNPALMDRLAGRYEKWSGDKGLKATTLLADQVATFEPDRSDATIAFWAGAVLTFAAALIVPVIFALGCLAGGRRLGIVASMLSSAIPSLVCFNPSLDGLGAVLACSAVLCWLWALRSRRAWVGIMCGVVWCLGLFWSFGLLSLVAILAVLALIWWGDVGDRGRPYAPALWTAVGLGAASLVLFLALGYNPVANAMRSLDVQSVVMRQRPYQLSMIWNLYDFLLFCGPTVLVAGLAGTLMAMSRSLKPRVVAAFGLAVLAQLVLLVLVGSTRGEVGRIWGFFMPLVALPAAVPVLRLRGWSLMTAGMLLLVGQMAMAMAINSYLMVVKP